MFNRMEFVYPIEVLWSLDQNYIIYYIQGVQIDVASGMGLLQECFWTLRGPQRLPWDPKDRRKLLLGKKHTIVG